ncbi:fluoride export protein 1-like isoform X2 [Cornus florida]|uniref:fluoride export protein 1-like isoform X2 n=1 Tax=Cornus florida TaxID=4283 RepID=UPI0028A1332B|nr:fluoride export protein 1-like isoform X2 [Cornus florida]
MLVLSLLEEQSISSSCKRILVMDLENNESDTNLNVQGLESGGVVLYDPTVSNTVSPVSPLPAEITSLSTDALGQSGDEKQETKKDLPWALEYISCLLHLAVLGIFGVLTRYLLQKLFGPAGIVPATGNHSYMYLDLPSNMVGSFLMGWFGVVFKRDIAKVSDFLALGLTTGYLGSLTTFSGWNQEMLDLSVEGQWDFVFLGFVVGLVLVVASLRIGIRSAKGFRWLLKRLNTSPEHGISNSKRNWKVDNYKRHLTVTVVLVLMLGILYGVTGTLLNKEFDSGSSEAHLWLACMVGPLGVWIRWWLSRLNGRGLGRAGLLKWFPFGTLIANVFAACVMAALAILKTVVNTKTCDNVANGIQFGLLGCLSTVSTFIVEFHALVESKHTWRAEAYGLITIVTSFVLGTLIYSLPFWIKGYKSYS